jgi:hypothetical protein
MMPSGIVLIATWMSGCIVKQPEARIAAVWRDLSLVAPRLLYSK